MGLKAKNIFGIALALVGAVIIIITVPNWVWFITLGGLCIAFGWTLYRMM